MSTKNIKLKPIEENLSDLNMRKVISLMFPETGKAITKKLACEILCISYNVARLDKLITSFKDREAFREKKMQENRGKPATEDEIKCIVRDYMKGESVTQIAKDLFRGVSFVNTILEVNDIPQKPRTQDYFKPELIPETAVRKEFKVDEVVYSARYDSLAKIKWESKPVAGENVYNIFLLDEKWMQHAYQPASELASLDKLKELGVNL